MTLQQTVDFISAFVRVIRKEQKTLDPLDFGITSPHWVFLVQKLADTWTFLCVLSFWPLLWLLLLMLFDGLGPNPIGEFHLYTGIWTLRFLLVSLCITPIQTLTQWRGMASYRQMFGLMAFFYGTLHVYGYLSIDQGWMWTAIARDVIETSYICYGIFGFVVVFLLAITTPKFAKKMMGKSWKKLHRWVYPASVAVILHWVMQLKGNLAEPFLYGVLLMMLLLFRVAAWWKNRKLMRLMIPRRPTVLDD